MENDGDISRGCKFTFRATDAIGRIGNDDIDWSNVRQNLTSIPVIDRDSRMFVVRLQRTHSHRFHGKSEIPENQLAQIKAQLHQKRPVKTCKWNGPKEIRTPDLRFRKPFSISAYIVASIRTYRRFYCFSPFSPVSCFQ